MQPVKLISSVESREPTEPVPENPETETRHLHNDEAPSVITQCDDPSPEVTQQQEQLPVANVELNVDATPFIVNEPTVDEITNEPNIADELVPIEGPEVYLQFPVRTTGWAFLSDVSSSPLLWVTMTVNKVPVLGLIDTGATHSITTMGVKEIAGAHLSQDVRHKVFGVGEAEGLMSSGTATIQMNIGSLSLKPHKFLIMDKKSFAVPIVLGMDFLKANNCTVDAEKRLLTWEDGQTIVDVYVDNQGTPEVNFVRQIPCFASSTVKISPGSSVQVPVTWSPPITEECDETLLYFEDVSAPVSKSVEGLPGVVSSKSGSASILLKANAGQAAYIPKGACIGILRSVVSLMEDEEIQPTDGWTESTLRDAIKVGSELDDIQQNLVHDALWNLKGVLSTGDDDIGHAGVTAHRIELLNDTPIYQRPRRFPAPIAQEIERQCQELYNLGIIEPSLSSYSSPVVPVRKKDGSIRLCIDYRALNKVTKADKFPLPNLSDSIFGLHEVKYFTKLDLVRGYYQVPLEEESREYTAFSTPHGHWQFNRLSFGLKNAPSAFQREMQTVLRDFPWKKVVVYIDDILIMGNSFEEHLYLVKRVLAMLELHGIKIKPAKCEWFSTEVEFLGHVVSRNGIKKTPQYVKKIDEFPRPTNVRQLREFLGLVNFQRKFVPGCSELQKPLSSLTGGAKTKKLEWTEEMIASFESLKNRVKEDLLLAFPDYGSDAEPLNLWVDASNYAAGACLTQRQDGEVRFIAFNSMTFNGAQLNYSTLDKELAALRWGVKSFQAFLYGAEFILNTDHQPLVYLQNMRLVDSRLARTLEDLADFNFVIRYTPGSLNTAADTLSRLRRIIEEPAPQQHVAPLPVGLHLGHPTPGGGDSMFISLLVALQACLEDTPPATHQALRELLVDEMLKNGPKYGVELNRATRRDLRLMRYSDQLPSPDLLLVASAIFKVKVVVYFWSENPVIYQADLPDDSTPVPSVYLQCRGGIHFNPLIEMKSSSLNVTSTDIVTMPVHVTIVQSDSVPDRDVLDELESLEQPDIHLPSSCSHVVGGQPTVTVTVGCRRYCAILDTGAELSLASSSLVEETELQCETSPNLNYQITGITGKKEQVLGFSQPMIVMDGDITLTPSMVAVVPRTTMSCCLLLGIDFLRKHSLLLDIGRGICRQRNAGSVNFNCSSSTSRAFIGYVCLQMPAVRHACIGPPESHIHLELAWRQEELTSVKSLLSDDSVLHLQGSSRQLRTLKNCLVQGKSVKTWPKQVSVFRRYQSKLTLQGDIIKYSAPAGLVPVVTFPLLIEIALVIHHQMAHIGRDKVADLILQQLWHPQLNSVAHDICSTCTACQMMKIHPKLVLPPTTKIFTSVPFELIAVDLVEFGPTSRGFIACLMVVDHNSKWVAAVSIRNKKSETVCDALSRQVLPFLPRLPDKLLSDNGPEFSAAVFCELLDDLGIKHVFSTPYRPASNGSVERVNRTIGSFLALLTAEPRHWDNHLPQAILTYNTTLHRELGMSPSQYLLTKSHATSSNLPLPAAVTGVWREGHPRFSPYKVGERVLRKIPFKAKLNATKFQNKYSGPFSVIKVNPNDVTYLIQLVSDPSVTLRAHFDQLTLWREPPDYLKQHQYYKILYPNGDLLPEEDDKPLMTSEERVETVNDPSEFVYVSSAESSFNVSSDESFSVQVSAHSLPVRSASPEKIKKESHPPVTLPSFPLSVTPSLVECSSVTGPIYDFPAKLNESWELSSIVDWANSSSLQLGLVPLTVPDCGERAAALVEKCVEEVNASFLKFTPPEIDVPHESGRLNVTWPAHPPVDDDPPEQQQRRRAASISEGSPVTLGSHTLSPVYDLPEQRRHTVSVSVGSPSMVASPDDPTVTSTSSEQSPPPPIPVSRPHTRSRGPAPVLPNVQSWILERKRNLKK